MTIHTVITKSGLILYSEGSAERAEPRMITGVENDFN
jgi:hypothetical protein